MSLNAASKEKPVANFLTSLIEAYPDAPMRDIAVLFTDIVGSTNFFKVHGDIRGREMLRTHHRLAMTIVEEYGGSLIKEVGDSVLVYYRDPAEALKSAIKMQQKFTLHNLESIPQDEIHVRIGLHHGRVIVEEKDIYGDVVNVAAKLTNLAGADQIFVSREVYEATKEIPSVQFEKMDFWNMKNVPEGLSIYKVAWETAYAAAPLKRVLLILQPDPGHPRIRGAVQNIVLHATEKDGLAGDQCLHVDTALGDKPVFIFGTTTAAIEAARRMMTKLRDVPENDGIVPLKMFVTVASNREEDMILTKGPGSDLDPLPFGAIYTNTDIHRQMRDSGMLFEPIGSLFRILDQNAPPAAAGIVPGAAAPAGQPRATYAPCFYCGSMAHPLSGCPSRTLTDQGKSLDHLGYLSMKEIEELAANLESTALSIDTTVNPFSTGTSPTRRQLAAHAYYDIKSLYQFRFFRIIWNSKAKAWETIFEAVAENEGGFAWLAQDSLRVSNNEKARSFLKLALERNPQDYKAYCVSGFLHLEENDTTAALAAFMKALEVAATNVRKIYVSLILIRLYKLKDDRKALKETLTGIFLLDGGCPEALYEDIVLRFKEGDEKTAIQRLIRLVGDNRNYFVTSLLDPELAPWRNTIFAHYTEIIAEARKDAAKYFEDARNEFLATRPLIPPSASQSIETTILEIERLLEVESYFGLLDVPHRCGRIKSMCKTALKEQIYLITDIVRSIQERIDRAIDVAGSYRYQSLVEKHKKTLAYLKGAIGQVGDVRFFESAQQFEDSRRLCLDISSQLSSVENRLEVLEIQAQIIRMCLRFLKHSSIMFSIVFVLGIFIFPLVSEQINALLSGLDISGFQSAWSIQKSFLIFGGIASIILSFVLTVREVIKDRR